MSKEEQKRKAEERKALRRERVLEKKAKEKDKEKAWLQREEHKAVLKRAKALLQRNQPTSTAVWEEESTSMTADIHPGPSVVREETDPLETSLVEADPSLISPWRNLVTCLPPSSSQHPGPFQGQQIPPKGI